METDYTADYLEEDDTEIPQCPYKKFKKDDGAAADGVDGNATLGATILCGDNEGTLQIAASEFDAMDEIGEGEGEGDSENGEDFRLQF